MFLTMPLCAGAKVGDFNGKTLSTVSGTVLEVDSLDLPGAQARSGLCWSSCSFELLEAALAQLLAFVFARMTDVACTILRIAWLCRCARAAIMAGRDLP